MGGRVNKRPRKRAANARNALAVENILNMIGNEDPSAENVLMTRQNQEGDEDVENAGDGMGVTETYSDYKPAKLNIGAKHPDPVVETGKQT